MAATFDEGDKVRRWRRNLNNPSGALKQIGALMTAESQRAFREQKHGEEEWPERAPVNLFGIISDFHAGKKNPPARRFETRPALRDTGRLSASIAFKLISKDTVEVGSNLPYAGVQHHGGEVESLPITEQVQLLLGAWIFRITGTQNESRADKLSWLLSKKWRDQTLTMTVPARPIVGVTKQTYADVKEAVGVRIFEAGTGTATLGGK